MSDPLLHVEKLNVAYGDVQVLWDVDLDIFPGEMVALVGANGAGKTTLLSTLSGILRAKSGKITFMGQTIQNQDTQELVDLGIAHVPEGRRLFNAMTVHDNLLMGAFRRKNREQVAQDIEGVLTMFPRLRERIGSLAGKLSGGEQQMVAIGRALMAKPRLLLIDELSLGLAPVIVEQLVDILVQVNQQGTTLMIVEQDVQVALEIAHRGYVLESGHVGLVGLAKDLLNDERVKKAYLGL